MRVFRLSKRKYAKALDGKGAAKAGNRWNSKGTEMIYTAESRALAMAEVAVHLSWALLPKDYVMIEIEIPDTTPIYTVQKENLADDWAMHPPRKSTQRLGDEFIGMQKYLIMQVPSAVVSGDLNYLINPNHKNFDVVKIKSIMPFIFDQRLFRT